MQSIRSLIRSSGPEMFRQKGVLRNFAKFTGKHLCQRLFFNKVAGQACKETLAQVFSRECCEISKNTFSYRTHPVVFLEMERHFIVFPFFITMIIAKCSVFN